MRILSAVVLFSLTAAQAVAQTQPSGAGSGLGGPAVAGVCLLSPQAVYANAKVGQAATARLKTLSDQAEAELAAERTPIEAELKALRTQQLAPAEREKRQRAAGERMQAFQSKAALRAGELEATGAKAMARISDEAQPVIAETYKARNCGLIVDRASVLGGNLSNDLTAAVVAGLDKKITTITFERENLASTTAGTGRKP